MTSRTDLAALPHRVFRLIPPFSSLSVHSLHVMSWPSFSSIYRPLQPSPSAALNAITSPYILTRREMLASRQALQAARDEAARQVGILASSAPRWVPDGGDINSQSLSALDVQAEIGRLYGLLCQVLDVPSSNSASLSKRSRSSTITPPSNGSAPQATPSALLNLLTTHLPRARASLDQTLTVHRRPSAITRLWFPMLFLPPALYSAVSLIARNKEWMKQQVRNARETVRGFVVQWVWEPLEGIGKTLRGGGEGLGVAPTTVASDQASLERMVIDLGRDYYKLSGPALEALGEKVKSGDMEEVLRVYEKEMQVSD